MSEPRTYPTGVPSWVDLDAGDVDAATAFYGGLFGWTSTDVMPPGLPQRYVIAQLDGRDVAAVGGPSAPGATGADTATWNTYVAVDDADAAAAAVERAGGTVVEPPADAGEGGRSVLCRDPEGAPFRLWQARRRLGAQAVNEPGAWNFSDLHAADPDTAARFYTEVFGWVVDDVGSATIVRRPGYGDHLAATVDPGIHHRQDGIQAPPGFADGIAWLARAEDGERPHWHVTFAVADRDEVASTAERLGATVLDRAETDWTRTAVVRDPQGAVLTVSQFLL
ncbi:VOC family protein [Terracoccus luteus]|uniref:VOC domain-containing protein n=1 Tax=Terracoccus luteus TaxID=53356 RepID=A0A495XY51_9MICO|nr:VOC family protein [Terracoccus luteus]MBB2986111.1 hypothetical protein [Terracoccus luteus]MCP2172299.1 hypothetical protein [Terracoccus luteus]RKT78862.1 hypothetical protein DFJ68_2316 [Terracoccus luteus]